MKNVDTTFWLNPDDLLIAVFAIHPYFLRQNIYLASKGDLMCSHNFSFNGVAMYSFLGGHGRIFLAEGACIRHCEYPTGFYHSIPFIDQRLLVFFGFKLLNMQPIK